MTGKRFGMYQNTLYDDGDILNPFDAMKLLNYFDKENVKLKEENEELKNSNHRLAQNLIKNMDIIIKLEKENEQLKQRIGNLEHTRDFYAECCERLEKENKQLKSEIRNVQRDYEQLWMHTYK